MIRLPRALEAWQTPGFQAALKSELEQLGCEHLPLQQGLATGSYALEDPVSVMIIDASEQAGAIRATAGIFYRSVIGGCSCADDPTPVDEQAEYCEVVVEIDKVTAEAKVTLLRD